MRGENQIIQILVSLERTMADIDCGIAVEPHGHSFEPFCSNEKAVDGTGLELAISSRNQDGDILFSSLLEQESTVHHLLLTEHKMLIRYFLGVI